MAFFHFSNLLRQLAKNLLRCVVISRVEDTLGKAGCRTQNYNACRFLPGVHRDDLGFRLEKVAAKS